MRLYEAQTRFAVVYGTLDERGNSATIGVQEGPAGRFTQFSCNTQSVQAGTRLTFDRRTCSLAGRP